ncbi:MAG: hypothetical protein FWG14_05565 [Peptococcaceae bacterium]|nr:hypothetical protein [Peptococcaceae bacterium]
MATYKQPCLHCGAMIERDSRICPQCHSLSPYGYRCPTCLRTIQKGQQVCSGCRRTLYVPCPTCKNMTFTGERCDFCGQGLMVHCTDSRCGNLQFFENMYCTDCGKKINKNIGG